MHATIIILSPSSPTVGLCDFEFKQTCYNLTPHKFLKVSEASFNRIGHAATEQATQSRGRLVSSA